MENTASAATSSHADAALTTRPVRLLLVGRVKPGAEPALRRVQATFPREAATEAGLVSADDAEVLVRSWRTVSRVRNAITLVQGKGSDQLPRDPRIKQAMAAVLGYPPGGSDEMVNDYLRTTRRARGVVDRIFWE